jgi:hypothetical protein
MGNTVITPLEELFQALGEAHYVDKITRPSKLSGHVITDRHYVLNHPEGMIVAALGDD